MSTTKDWTQVIKDSGNDADNSINITIVGDDVGIGGGGGGSADVVDFIDTTPVLDTSSTNIPASASNPVQIVASLASNVSKIRVNDTTGFFIGVYTGAALSEVLQCVVGPGMDGEIEVDMDLGQRVSLRHMANSVINSGEICIQFLG